MKQRLRHPIRAIREPFGTAGLIVAMIALVAALGGTALAAAKLNSTQKKEVEKIAKKYAGKPGATGPAGAAGKEGAKGTDGANGSPGANGKSVVVGNATVGECAAGGKTVEAEGSGVKSPICNGKNGTTGFTETLPKGKAETGTWGFTNLPGPLAPNELKVPLSFSIPLEAPLASTSVHFVGANETGPPACNEGTSEAPAAAPGNLCIYITFGVEPEAEFEELKPSKLNTLDLEKGEPGAGKDGALLTGGGGLATGSSGAGTWIVRAAP